MSEEKTTRAKFRFAKQRAFFTYKTHINKKTLKGFFDNLKKTKTFIAAHESGDETNNYPHTHCYVEWDETYDTKNERAFDVVIENNIIHPHIKGIGKRKEDLKNVMRYLAKEDKENEYLKDLYPEEKPVLAIEVWKCNTIQEVAMLAKRPAEVAGLLQLYDIKKKQKVETMKPEDHLHWMWQNMMWNQLTDDNWDYRAIRWIIGVTGNEGKSLFAAVFKSNFPEDTLIVTQFAGQSNIANVMQNALAKGWNGKVLIVDFPRDAEAHQIYEPLEAIMNGNITATKYQGSELQLPQRPKVLVFANFYPNYEKMSKDRWYTGKIELYRALDGTDNNAVIVDELNEARDQRLREEQLKRFYKNRFTWRLQSTDTRTQTEIANADINPGPLV